MTRIQATFGWPPSANHAWRPTKKHGKILSDEYKAFIEHVGACVLEQRIPRHWTSAKLLIALNCRAPNLRSFDIDNRVKTTLDAIVRAGVIADDKDVDLLIVLRGAVDPPYGSIGVVIEELKTVPCDTTLALGEYFADIQPAMQLRVPAVRTKRARTYRQIKLFKGGAWCGVTSAALRRK